MAYVFKLYAPGSDVDIALTYSAYVRNESTDLYLDSDLSFVAFNQLVDGTHDLVENPNHPGEWLLEVALPAFTGQLTILPLDENGELLTSSVTRVYVVNNTSVPAIPDRAVYLDSNYASLGDLQLVDNDGNKLEGVSVRIFTRDAFDAGDYALLQGATVTTSQGTWLSPVPVDPGNTYVVLFSKLGWVTTHVEISVPAIP